MYRSILMIILLALPSASLYAMGADKVTLCHNNNEISVGGPAVWAHIGHGDFIKEEGVPCSEGPPDPEPEPEDTMSVVVMMRCEAQGDDFVVVSFSASEDFASIQPVEPVSCPVALAELLDLGLDLRSVTGGSAEEGGSLHLFTDYLLIGEVEVEGEDED